MRRRLLPALAAAVLTLAPRDGRGDAGAAPAPSPTDTGNSPAAPDPHPPRGGLDSQGRAVGGAALLGRGDVLPAGAPALPKDLTARAWVVADLDTGAVVAARDAHGRYQPASIQKVLTTAALLLLPGSRQVTVSRAAADTEGSHAGLVAGGTYTVDQIFEGLLLVSGNDAAEALAEAAGGRAQTVALMNRTALALGACDTLVQTPSGLDGWQQLTSAYDMAVFLRAAADQPRFLAYDRVRSLVLPAQRGTGAVRLVNQNLDFLDEVPGAVAAKTGFTDAAQHTFAGVIARGGHRYGVVLLRAQRYPQDQYVQAARLVSWAAALPAGTPPVGALPAVPRVLPAAPTTAAPSAPMTSGSATSAAEHPASPSPSPTGTHSSPSRSKLLLGIVLIIVLFLLFGRLRGFGGDRSGGSGRRRPRGRLQPRPPGDDVDGAGSSAAPGPPDR